ncbi:hypothetical protein BE15_17765 [Sorangium cellulosum]|uniref:BIG2 domain-containing protein n=1 Tax=Sorangium cellulosum TaxID=56 RepID=A0A150Q9H5_SORCE|nr:hypothetical protein BE15_17765 [Sorangium cellulosum]
MFSARAGSRKADRGALLLALAAAGAACSSSSDGGTGASAGGAQGGGGSSSSGAGGAVEGLVSLRVDPGTTSVELAYGKAAAVQLSAIGRFQDGSERDVTGRVTWSADDLFAHVDAGQLTTASPGRVRVTAAGGSITATAEVTVKVAGEIALPGAPPGREPGRRTASTSPSPP